MKKILDQIWPLILYFAISIFSVIPFFTKGFFQIHDDVQVSRVYEMAKSLSVGMLPVRWVSDLGYGLGYPIFNFYSVLPYYIGGTLSVLLKDPLIATKIVFIISIIASGVSMYFLVKMFFGRVPALVSSIIYLYFPYHAVNIYVRGDLAELWAYAFLPLVFLSFFKLHELNKFSKFYIILGALSVATVILSHNLSALMLFIFLGIFIIYSLLTSQTKKEIFISYASILVLGFLISAFYAVPAALESKYTNVLTQVGGGADFRDHFVCVQQLWDSPWGFGGSTKGCVDGLSFKLGKFNVLLLILSIPIIFHSFKILKNKKFVVTISVIFLILSIFMMIDVSGLLWSLPLMDFLQYPWRFLNFTGVFASVVIGFLVWYVFDRWSTKVAFLIAGLIIVLTLMNNSHLFVPQKILNRTSSYYTNSKYLNWTASKISDEYLPKGFHSPQNFDQINNPRFFNTVPINDFFRLKDNKFESVQTPLEITSDFLSVIGVACLLIVIIKPSIIFRRDSI